MADVTSQLKVGIIQSDIVWENVAENLGSIEAQIMAVDADLVVLPEMFATGFSMSPERISQPAQGCEIVERMQKISTRTGRALVFSCAVKESDHYFNRLYFLRPDGQSAHYNKRHLFRMAGEHNHYTGGGVEKLIVEYKGVRICPMVCYDLRFPVYSRRTEACDYDLLIYIASWPAARRAAWDTLLLARAIENQTYCIGVNRVGSDPKNDYSGGSVVVGFMGEKLAQMSDNTAGSATATLSITELKNFRTQFPAIMDADKFTIE